MNTVQAARRSVLDFVMLACFSMPMLSMDPFFFTADISTCHGVTVKEHEKFQDLETEAAEWNLAS